MKKLISVIVMTSMMLALAACGKESIENDSTGTDSVIISNQEVTASNQNQEIEFVLGENLAGAITELALRYDEFDMTAMQEDSYPDIFLSAFCQNSRFTFDYLANLMEKGDGILSQEQVEYIQYSLTGENVDFTDYVGEEGIDIYQSTSGLLFGEIASYEGEVKGKEVALAAVFEFRTMHDIEAERPTKVYELTVALEKNEDSCFDGYSIKSMSKKDVTPVVWGDGEEHIFYGMDMGIEENGVFILECFGGADEVAYGTHVEVDLSENPALAEMIRENPGEELEITYIWESTLAEPITSVIPTDIKIVD